MGSKSTWQASRRSLLAAQRLHPRGGGRRRLRGRTNFTGTMLSLGGSYAQLDLGFRPHWWSPAYDSSMLMSTEAPRHPSCPLRRYPTMSRSHPWASNTNFSWSGCRKVRSTSNNPTALTSPRLAPPTCSTRTYRSSRRAADPSASAACCNTVAPAAPHHCQISSRDSSIPRATTIPAPT
jgi:hypothetical protein